MIIAKGRDMVLITQSNSWSCLPASFAMACNTSLDTVLELIGHDGSRVIRPGEGERYKRRAFHVQELIDAAFRLNYATIPFEAEPILSIGRGQDIAIDFPGGLRNRLITRVAGNVGVFTGLSVSNNPHAVAWDGRRIYDPKGEIYAIDSFNIQTFWMLKRLS